MVIRLIIKSKNINSIINFIKLLKKFYKIYKLTDSFFVSNKPRKRKMFSILRSPHVNKISQEQFEFKVYKREIIIQTKNYLKFLIMFKKLNKSIFSDLNITISLLKKKNDYYSPILNKFYLNYIDSNYLYTRSFKLK